MNSDDIKKVTEKKAAELNEQMLHLRKKNEMLESQIMALRLQVGEQKEVADTLRNTIQALEPLRPVLYESPTGRHSDSDIHATVKLSDWHIGEVIRPEETEGFGRYNYAIAEGYIRNITQKFIAWVETHRMAFKIPIVHVLCEQDFISGSIHDELLATNEFPAPVQAVKAGMLLGQTIATLAPHFPEVHVHEIGGDNHSRLQRKPQAKEKGLNSYGYIVTALANLLLEKHPNVKIHSTDAMMKICDVNGWKLLSMHGDTVKAWMGIPYYGLARQRGKEAFKRMAVRHLRDVAFDFISTAHWHVPGIIENNILTNGSLSGTSEYDHACGRHADPSQVSFLMHPRYKLFDWVAWHPTFGTERSQ